jgi:hypothetical protein
MPWGLQFGQPKVKGYSQYLDELLTDAGCISPVMVMLGVYSHMVPWSLILIRKENALAIAGPYPTVHEALVTALQLGEPYILILHKNIPQLEMAKLVSKIYFERKKCGVVPVPAECIDWVKEHEHDNIPISMVEEKVTIFARKD